MILKTSKNNPVMTSISLIDLAKKYGICEKTLYNWLKEAKIERRVGYPISVEEQKIIFDMFGDPAASVSRAKLADMYGINAKTLYNWFKRANLKIREGCAICSKEQKIIFDMFGDPSVFKQRKLEKAAKRAWDKNRKNK